MRYFTIGLFAVLFLVFLLNLLLSRNKNGRATDIDEAFEEDRLANSSRKKDIGDEFFVKPDIKKLPFSEYDVPGRDAEAASRAAAEVEKLAKLPMIKFSRELSNNEIKMMFGAANLEGVTGYEENYSDFTLAMIRWAEALINMGEYADAALVLEETVRMGSDFSKSYTLLADAYLRTGGREALRELFKKVTDEDFMRENRMLRQTVVSYIEALLEGT